MLRRAILILSLTSSVAQAEGLFHQDHVKAGLSGLTRRVSSVAWPKHRGAAINADLAPLNHSLIARSSTLLSFDSRSRFCLHVRQRSFGQALVGCGWSGLDQFLLPEVDAEPQLILPPDPRHSLSLQKTRRTLWRHFCVPSPISTAARDHRMDGASRGSARLPLRLETGQSGPTSPANDNDIFDEKRCATRAEAAPELSAMAWWHACIEGSLGARPRCRWELSCTIAGMVCPPRPKGSL